MDRLAAPNLQWETTKAWNAGVDSLYWVAV